MTLSGTSSATTAANGSGAYTFTGLANGSYTVTPSQTGFTFSPASLPATIASANVTGLNFTATAQPPATFSISGTLSPAAGGAGATVTLSGASSATTTANGSGAYTFTGLANGSYTVTPSHTGFTFSPASLPATIASANVTGLNFTATAQPPPTFSISGTLSPTTGGAGATVTLSGASSATTTANGSGAYTFTGLANGSYTVTPSQTGFTFSPASLPATIASANVTGLNFTATAQPPATFSISGTLSPAAGGAGATVTLSGASSATTTANGSGAYTFTGLANGNYTVTPSHTGFTFSPASLPATIASANITGLNFTATAQPPPTFSISGTISPTTGGAGATVTLSGASSATTDSQRLGRLHLHRLGSGNLCRYTQPDGIYVQPNNAVSADYQCQRHWCELHRHRPASFHLHDFGHDHADLWRKRRDRIVERSGGRDHNDQLIWRLYVHRIGQRKLHGNPEQLGFHVHASE